MNKIILLKILVTIVIIYYLYYIGQSESNESNEHLTEGFTSSLTHNNISEARVDNPKLFTLRQRAVAELPKLGSYHQETLYFKLGSIIQNLYPLGHYPTEGGSIENLQKLGNGDLDLAIVQENMFYDAHSGQGFFKKKPIKNIRFMTGFFFDLFTLITYQNSGVTSWKDLKGRIIGLPGKKTASYHNFLKIVQSVGLDPEKDLTYVNVENPNRLANLLLDKKIQAIFMTTNNKNPYIINLARKMSLRFIGTGEIDDDLIVLYFPLAKKKLISTSNYYSNINTSEFIKTYGIRTILACRQDFDSDKSYQITRKIYQNIENIKFESNNFLFSRNRNNEIQDAFLPSEMSYAEGKIPIHDGSRKYYIDSGHITFVTKPNNNTSENNNKIMLMDNSVGQMKRFSTL